MKELPEQFVRYIIVGVFGTGLHAVVFALMNELVFGGTDQSDQGLSYVLANTVAFIASSVTVFIANRFWVFSVGKGTRKSVARELVLFYAIASVGWLLGTPLGAWLVSARDWNEYLALIVTLGASIGVNFTGRKYIVFRNRFTEIDDPEPELSGPINGSKTGN